MEVEQHGFLFSRTEDDVEESHVLLNTLQQTCGVWLDVSYRSELSARMMEKCARRATEIRHSRTSQINYTESSLTNFNSIPTLSHLILDEGMKQSSEG